MLYKFRNCWFSWSTLSNKCDIFTSFNIKW